MDFSLISLIVQKTQKQQLIELELRPDNWGNVWCEGKSSNGVTVGLYIIRKRRGK